MSNKIPDPDDEDEGVIEGALKEIGDTVKEAVKPSISVRLEGAREIRDTIVDFFDL